MIMDGAEDVPISSCRRIKRGVGELTCGYRENGAVKSRRAGDFGQWRARTVRGNAGTAPSTTGFYWSRRYPSLRERAFIDHPSGWPGEPRRGGGYRSMGGDSTASRN